MSSTLFPPSLPSHLDSHYSPTPFKTEWGFSLCPSHRPPKSDSLLSLVGPPLTPTSEPTTRILVESGGANRNVHCGSCRVPSTGRRCRGRGAGGGLVAIWSEERAEAAAVAIAVARAPRRTSYFKALTPYPVQPESPALPAAAGLPRSCSHAWQRAAPGAPGSGRLSLSPVSAMPGAAAAPGSSRSQP